MARGVDGCAIFTADRERVSFLDDMARVEHDSNARIIAYCLMGNHFHFAIQVGPVKLGTIMQRVMTGHALRFNRNHKRTGHLFQARHQEALCLDDRYLANLIRYIHLNPVRAGLVSRPQDWPWSSFSGHEPLDESDVDADFDPWPATLDQKTELIRCLERDVPDLPAIGAVISGETGISVEELRSGARLRPVIAAKRLFAREAIKSGHPLNAISRWLNLTPSSITRYAQANTAITGKPDTIR